MRNNSKELFDVTITDTNENFETWINRKYVSDNTKNQLRDADILIVPNEGFRDSSFPVFPAHTEKIYSFLKKELPPELRVDICIEDDDYKELSLHANLIILGVFVVTAIAVPTLVNLLSEYLKRKIFGNKDEQKVKVSLTVVDDAGHSQNFTYEGSSSNLGTIIDKLKETKKLK